MLKKKIASIEGQMRESLDQIRHTFEHAGDTGAASEDTFRKFLRQYIPRKLEIGHGEIIDSRSQRSGQTDIIIVNDEHPLTFTAEKPGLFFVEGINAAGEIKTRLTSNALKNTLKSSMKFKTLEIRAGKGTLVTSNQSDLQRFYRCPPCFLFAYESQLMLKTIRTTIEDFTNSESLDYLKILDAVFILGKGSVINFGDGKGSFQFRTPDGTSHEGWQIQESDSVLFDMLTWISVTMPRMVRFSAILNEYLFENGKRV